MTLETAVRPWQPDADDMGIGRVDDLLSITRVRIDGGKGFFRLSSQPQNREIRALDVVVLYRMPETRALYPARVEGSSEPQEPLCVSYNGVVPKARVDLTAIGGAATGPTCASCPYGQWSDGGDGRRVPPPCKESMNFALANVVQPGNKPLPYALKVGGTSMKGVKELINTLIERQSEAKTPTPIFGYIVQLKGVYQQNKAANTSWYTLGGEVTGMTAPETWRDYATLRSRFKNQAATIAAQQVEIEIAEDARGGATAGAFGGGREVVMTDPDELPFERPEDSVLQKPAFNTKGEPIAHEDWQKEAFAGVQAGRPVATPGGNGGWQDRPATEPQIKAIYAIARGAVDMDDGTLEEWCRSRFGVAPFELSRRQASEAIDALKLGVAQ